ncbi:amidophosphoribosyltransferase [Ignisphaera aggregans DSM 17230]|uniref:Amidophosphoribosyltransferase n=1 Tax=Ignisphaera aggregans (strain DSM 17230 / JCM 13409 / AQ1.S1) TaxID=583356 RepID=E0ST77_IGNAA|nr:amidophosphoribosyltransferase [Ignisphaera aggregans DSM 17230]
MAIIFENESIAMEIGSYIIGGVKSVDFYVARDVDRALGRYGIQRFVAREYLRGEMKKINARQDRFLHRRYLDNIFAVGTYQQQKRGVYLPLPDDVTPIVSDVKDVDRKCIEVASMLISKLFNIYEELKNVEALTYVPCHEQNLRIDPKTNECMCIAEELAKRVGKYVNKPVVKLVEKVKHVDLKNMSVEERWLTVQQLYKPLEQVHVDVDIESMAIIDDVITSGATLSYIAKILKEYFNVKKVYGVAIAITK